MLVLAHLHRSVLTQQVHSLGHLAFKWRSSFAKALAKLSPNFREKSPNSFYKMIHIYIINTKYKYLQCNLDMCTWTFAKTLARKKFSFAISEKTLAETVNCIPKGLRKGNPFQGPFAQLSYIAYIRQSGSKTPFCLVRFWIYKIILKSSKKNKPTGSRDHTPSALEVIYPSPAIQRPAFRCRNFLVLKICPPKSWDWCIYPKTHLTQHIYIYMYT